VNAVLVGCLTDVLAFLELSDDGVVNPDAAVSLMEEIASKLQQLSPPERADLIDAMIEHAHQEGDPARREFLADLPGALGLL
jgi:hypothetical protein